MNRLSLLIIASLLALGGCSLVVSGLEPPECTSNDQCAVLNEMEGISNDACTLYQCDAELDRCVLGTRDADRDGLVAAECAGPGDVADCNDAAMGGSERCNGVDDDCDGVIDEAFMQDEMLISPLPGALAENRLPLTDATGSGVVASGTGETGLAVAHATGGQATFGLFGGESVMGPTAMSYQRTRRLDMLSAWDLEMGCHVRSTDSMSFTAGSCRFDDLAFGLSAQSVFVATVNGSGCTEGQLRVGYMPRTEAARAQVIERGPLRRSNAFFGIDTDPAMTGGRACTGASRAGGSLGATRPAIGALADEQALVAWLAAPLGRDACGGAPVDVEVLALHRQMDAGGTRGWVTASNEAQPQVIGSTSGGGAPAIDDLGQGYVVAFPSEGGIALRWVARMDTPPAFPGSGDPNDRAGLETGPLRIVELGTIATDGPAEDIGLASGTITMQGTFLGVTWRTGCGSADGRVWFRQLVLPAASDGFTLDESLSRAAVELTVSPGEVGPPAIVFEFDGFLQPGVEGARPAAGSAEDGGWVVAWTQGGAVLARRLSEMDGQLLSPDELITLSGPESATRSTPLLYLSGEQIRYAFLEVGSAETGIFEGALTCAPE
ncbi:MAG: putative metal-binding motif-containing protein [Sandaracinaceae bacterium]